MIRARSYAEAGVDVIYFGDDIGMQQTIMMSEELYCRWLKPRLTRLVDMVKACLLYTSVGGVDMEPAAVPDGACGRRE